MNPGAIAVVVLLALAGCDRRPRIATPAAAEETASPAAPAPKGASSVPLDPIAKIEAERLARTAAPPGALSDPEKLAGVCLEARVACGFELRDGVWDRPEARASPANATAAQALAGFMGKDYRLAWIGPVAHVFPAAAAGPAPLDGTVAADVGMNSPSREPAETIHDVAVALGLRMPAPRPRERRVDLVGASTMPVQGSARDVLDSLCRPALLRPSSYVAVYGPGRDGSLRWYWGEPPAW